MPTPSSSPPAPLQQITLTADDLKEPALLNNILQNLTQQVNYILGHGGEPPFLKAGANFGGMPVTNVGAPVSDSDVVTMAYASANLGAAAIQPQLQALGKNVFQTYRRIGDPVQRETSSSFLNKLQSTAPTANTANVSSTAPSGGSVNVTVSSGLHQRVDGSNAPFASRTDTLSLPAQFGTNTLARSGNIVTVNTTAPTTIAVGNEVGIAGQGDPSFAGVFVVLTAPTSSQFTYYQVGPNASTTGGGGSLLSVYYYTISTGQSQLGLAAAAGADTWSARTVASIDGTTIIGVVVLSSGGMDLINSAAGATPPVANANVAVIRRM